MVYSGMLLDSHNESDKKAVESHLYRLYYTLFDTLSQCILWVDARFPALSGCLTVGRSALGFVLGRFCLGVDESPADVDHDAGEDESNDHADAGGDIESGRGFKDVDSDDPDDGADNDTGEDESDHDHCNLPMRRVTRLIPSQSDSSSIERIRPSDRHG